MPHRFARCQNTDYCALADKRLVLRLADDESFYCPECAHPLTPAPPWGNRRAPWAVLGAVGMAGAAVATSLLVVQNWPSAMAYMPPSVSTTLAFLAPAPKPPDLVAMITGTAPADTLPTPQQFLVAATMDSWLPHQAGDHVLRRRHPRPPRADQAAAAARALLEAGVPPFSSVEETDVAAAMPWRQALIMAALVTPGQPMPVAEPAPVRAAAPAPMPVAEPAPVRVAAPAPAAAAPPPDTTPAFKPHASLMNPPTETDAEHKLELALADGFIRGIRQDDSGLADHIVTPAPVTPLPAPAKPASDKPAPAPAPAAANPPTAIAHAPALPTPRGPETALNSAVAKSPAAQSLTRTASVSGPTETHQPPAHPAATAGKTPGRPTTKRLASARIPAPRPTLAANILAPVRPIVSQPAAAPSVAAAPPQKPAPLKTAAAPASILPAAPQAAAPHPRSVILADGFAGLKYGALKDTNLQSIPTVAATEKLTGGSMMVDCAVPANGVPTDCKLLQSDKSPAVAHAVLAMLTSGLVHKTPKSDHGRLVRQSWPINFPANQPHRVETLEPDDRTP